MGCTESSFACRPERISGIEHTQVSESPRAQPHQRSEATGSCPTLKTQAPCREAYFHIQVVKTAQNKVGAGFGITCKGAVIIRIKPGGILDEWNKQASEEKRLSPGFILQEVNGVTGFWNIIDTMHRPGDLDIKVSTTPPPDQSEGWFELHRRWGHEIDSKGGPDAFISVMRPPSRRQDGQLTLHRLSTIAARAGDVGVDQCAICLDEIPPEASLVQLPCGHAYHALCAARWLMQDNASAGKLHGCPLCCRQVVTTSYGAAYSGLRDRVT